MQPQQYVGIDLHHQHSVIVRMSAEGEKLSCVRLPNDPVEVATEIAKAGKGPEVVIEATYGWNLAGGPAPTARGQGPPGPPPRVSMGRPAAHQALLFHRRPTGQQDRPRAAAELLTLVYYGLRDGEVRCLAKSG